MTPTRAGRRARRPRLRLLSLPLAASLALLPSTAAHADGIRDQQWALEAMHTQEAWRTTKGAGITVAVLDTGVDDEHPDLVGNILPTRDMVGFGASRGDRAWARHGTAMAGIIAGHGHGPNNADGVLGIAPEARILPVRVILEDKDAARSKARSTRGNALAEGIRWAADQDVDVINLSLGDDSESAHPEPSEDAAVQYALAKGSIVVASAGNGGAKGDHISYPAAYPGVIAVTAVDEDGDRAPFSTRRWYATVSAPGVDVVIADPDRKYYEGWGTSAAAAFVSGAAALIKAAHPSLTPAQVKRLLEETAREAPAGGRDDSRGFGFVDPAAAIEKGAALTSDDLKTASYGGKYFGSGPDPVEEEDPTVGWAAPAAGGAGAFLLVMAVMVWRGRGRGRPDDYIV
ncbi:type VII secretion-associated serine protease mycosin [Streptomyces stelliscabiei]|uniref:Type VII secretion-associated serine protease mycosin n=1 Tax=Streptomyces stelliscabiei TaxID=146820 RepID=A0A8I0TPP6_9ACTN|nr:type VII secretion-associated serine protease mycosin [Streptomyces stelliscabiei]KND43494.1 serine protease [Streptomyces stelliscabiei]MBE1595819.1 type VII secretion-associated serine protease mycosin [Streptomyces stelliscabiei]MDX2517834.1 type VII secretion-associated serine protease mycosin [Streptomyces stelliscabiei]MDX2555646.1 type VII secretion-associated serine protease mycosin [Streptomyces stelliscabiei]MDX2614165.1 type VII secretion-associated serine protease mycosin [Strep